MKPYLGENDDMAPRTTSIQEGEDDEDIPTIDVTDTTTPPTIQGPMTRARPHQLNQQVLISFLQATPNIHENMMLPKSNVFVSLRNDGPSMDERDKLWSMYVGGDGSRSATNGDDDAWRLP